MDRARALAQSHGLLLLEDAAQAHGARYRGRRAGSLGAAAAFSFYPSKNLGALGDGGAVCTDDELLAARLRRLRNLGQRAKGEHVELGYNERLDALQAALLRVKLPHLDAWNQRRREHARAYRELLDPRRAPCRGQARESIDLSPLPGPLRRPRRASPRRAPQSRNRDRDPLLTGGARTRGVGGVAAAPRRPAGRRGVGGRRAVSADASRPRPEEIERVVDAVHAAVSASDRLTGRRRC